MKVSVATITYNHDPFIAQAIESVLMQETDFAFEYVIGDDCSTDGTRETVEDYASRYPEVVRPLLRQHNVGAPSNFIQTLAQCRGDYIAFLDGDDYWTSPVKLQKQADFLDTHPECSMCFHPIEKLSDDGTIRPFHPPARKHDNYVLKDLLRSNIVTSLSAMSRAGRFRGFPEWHNDSSGTVGDWVYHVIVASQGDIGYIDEIMGVHREHGGGIFSAIDEAGRRKISMRTLALLDEELDFRYSPDIDRTLNEMYLDLANTQLSSGLREDARESLAKFFNRSPARRQIISKKMLAVLLRLYVPFLAEPMIAVKKKFASRS